MDDERGRPGVEVGRRCGSLPSIDGPEGSVRDTDFREEEVRGVPSEDRGVASRVGRPRSRRVGRGRSGHSPRTSAPFGRGETRGCRAGAGGRAVHSPGISLHFRRGRPGTRRRELQRRLRCGRRRGILGVPGRRGAHRGSSLRLREGIAMRAGPIRILRGGDPPSSASGPRAAGPAAAPRRSDEGEALPRRDRIDETGPLRGGDGSPPRTSPRLSQR
mmetsp:Transcript_3618/g.9707  ORF Transcript_3618/g.9707 Transcript_3618/m.9707 type:complete len:217 (+) Transcript_3618:711-1361(+)